jgi:hypothetical protein
MTYDPRNAFSEQQAAFGRASGVTTSIRPKARPGSLGAKKDDKPKVTFKSAFEAAGGNTRKKEKQNVFPMKVYESPRFKIPERPYISTTTLDDAPASADPILDMPNVRSFMAPSQSEPFKGYVAGEEPVRGRSPGRGLMSPPQPEAPNVPQYQDAIMRQLTRAQMETTDSIPRPKIRPATSLAPTMPDNAPINVRNNNLGNIKNISANQWQGQNNLNTDETFAAFDTAELGVRALKKVITANIKATDTFEEYVNRYASEPHEKAYYESTGELMPHLKNYAKIIASSQGVSDIKSKMPSLNTVDMVSWIKATAKAEGGEETLEYFTDKVIEAGIKLK